jgi:hypothetical protein
MSKLSYAIAIILPFFYRATSIIVIVYLFGINETDFLSEEKTFTKFDFSRIITKWS